MRGQPVAKPPGASDGLAGIGPLKPAIEMQTDPAFQRNALLPSNIHRIFKFPMKPLLDFLEQDLIGPPRPHRALIPKPIVDGEIRSLTDGPLGEIKNILKIRGIVPFWKIGLKTLKKEIDLFHGGI
jgi:hypothetical protein